MLAAIDDPIYTNLVIQQLNNHNSGYPERLKQLHKPPKQLFIRGHLATNQPLVAIVGSRRPTAYGKRVTEEVSSALARLGVGVISGLALGVDGIAHSQALRSGGYTAAVLAHGLDRVQPSSHSQLAQQILDSGGALMSEYSSGTPALKNHFLQRNRIVAALSDAVVITEATRRSGTASTARFALELGRPVLAVPGSIYSVLSKGTNNLIAQGATPLLDTNDILHAIGYTRANPTNSIHAENKQQHEILALLQQNPGLGQNELMDKIAAKPAETLTELSKLEISGHIKRLENGQYVIDAS